MADQDPQELLKKLIAQSKERRDRLLEWLDKEHPEVFTEQRHLHKGTSERVYWHHGYMMALSDVLRAIGAPDEQGEEPWDPPPPN